MMSIRLRAQSLRRVIVTAIRLAAPALALCACKTIIDVVPDPLRAWDASPVQTDSLVYHLVRGPSEYRAYVKATYTNRTNVPVYFARCNSQSTTPMFSLRRTGADSTSRLFFDWAWACVGGVPAGVIAPGASVTVRVPVGSVDQPSMTPPLKAENLVGLMRVQLVLCRANVSDSDDCVPVPSAEAESNAFTVSY